jgi:CBS domain-containing protein
MSSPVIKVEGNTSVRDSALLMINQGIGSLIVTHADKPVGIVTETDLIERVVALCKDPCEISIREVMSKPIIWIDKNKGILEAIRRMRDEGISRLLVMDGDSLVGIVSERDLLRGVSIASLTSFNSLLRIKS